MREASVPFAFEVYDSVVSIIVNGICGHRTEDYTLAFCIGGGLCGEGEIAVVEDVGARFSGPASRLTAIFR